MNALPEVAANLSGGGFSFYFERENYQHNAVTDYLQRFPDIHDGLYKCARCQARCGDLAFSYFL